MVVAFNKLDDSVAPLLNPLERKLGEVLVDSQVLEKRDVDKVLSVQVAQGGRFGEIAVRLGLATRRQLLLALAQQSRFPYVMPGKSTLSKRLTAAYNPFGPRAEAFRGLRSELMLRWFDKGQRALCVLGAREDEQADVLAANLAIVFAQLGERTLLIDANLRQAKPRDLFGLNSSVGLAEYLRGFDCLATAMTSVRDFSELSVMPAGTPPPNPQELLSRETFTHLIQSATRNYDVVIVSCPPALESADAQIVARCVGGAVLSLKRHSTRAADVSRMQSLLEPTGATLVGTVLDG
jgi:protein-tyrosine kinase